MDTDDQNEMLATLLSSHEVIRGDIISGIKQLEGSDDFGSIDILNSRLTFHDKAVWMLKATLKK